MDPKLKEILEKLAEATLEQKLELAEALRAKLTEMQVQDKFTNDDLALIEEHVAALEQVETSVEADETANAELQSRAADLFSKVKPVAKPAEEPVEPPAAVEVPKPQEPVVEPPAAVVEVPETIPDEEKELEPVAASGKAKVQPSLEELAARRPAKVAPKVAPNSGIVITAAADVPGFSAGMPISTGEEMGKAFAEKVESLMGGKNLGSRYPVARMSYEYPEDRQLVEGESARNSALVASVISPQAIIASGGLCAPVEASYALANISQASRPLRDMLPKFNANRGGIRFITPPLLTDLTNAVGVWTHTNDANPSSPSTKPCLSITCGTPVEVDIDAVTLCLQVGNFARRTFPEQFATFYDLALAMHARVAEGNILDRLSALSTAVTDTTPNLGAARDLLEQYGRLAAQYRSRHRMAPDSTLQVALPDWAGDLMREDFARQLPGNGQNVLALAEAEINGYFAARNLDVTWYLDTRTNGGQVYGVQSAGQMNGWQLVVEGYIFAPGTFVFLDGGTLDLGVDIRDSTLISTNDVRAFMETFENVAKTGIESLRVRSSVCATGLTAGTAVLTCTAS